MEYNKQIGRLEKELGDYWQVLKDCNAFVAGGFWTSTFTGKEINDIDIYFRDVKSLRTAICVLMSSLEDAFEDNLEDDGYEDYFLDEDTINEWCLSTHCAGYTDKSIIFITKSGIHLQFIHTKFYESAEDIFNTFDFTINMCAYDFKKDKMFLNENFLVDLAGRNLVVNTNTSFPIISQLRIAKYLERGYKINRKEFLKLSCAVAKLNLNTWEEAISQLAGMYGWTVDEIFDKSKPFSMDELISQLDLLEQKEDIATVLKTGSCEDILNMIDKIYPPVRKSPSDGEVYFYKSVASTEIENIFKSHFREDFLYRTGHVVQDFNQGVYFYKTIRGAKNHKQGGIVIKLKPVDKDTFEIKQDFFGNKYKTNSPMLVVGKVDVK